MAIDVKERSGTRNADDNGTDGIGINTGTDSAANAQRRARLTPEQIEQEEIERFRRLQDLRAQITGYFNADETNLSLISFHKMFAQKLGDKFDVPRLNANLKDINNADLFVAMFNDIDIQKNLLRTKTGSIEFNANSIKFKQEPDKQFGMDDAFEMALLAAHNKDMLGGQIKLTGTTEQKMKLQVAITQMNMLLDPKDQIAIKNPQPLDPRYTADDRYIREYLKDMGVGLSTLDHHNTQSSAPEPAIASVSPSRPRPQAAAPTPTEEVDGLRVVAEEMARIVPKGSASATSPHTQAITEQPTAEVETPPAAADVPVAEEPESPTAPSAPNASFPQGDEEELNGFKAAIAAQQGKMFGKKGEDCWKMDKDWPLGEPRLLDIKLYPDIPPAEVVYAWDKESKEAVILQVTGEGYAEHLDPIFEKMENNADLKRPTLDYSKDFFADKKLVLDAEKKAQLETIVSKAETLCHSTSGSGRFVFPPDDAYISGYMNGKRGKLVHAMLLEVEDGKSVIVHARIEESALRIVAIEGNGTGYHDQTLSKFKPESTFGRIADKNGIATGLSGTQTSEKTAFTPITTDVENAEPVEPARQKSSIGEITFAAISGLFARKARGGAKETPPTVDLFETAAKGEPVTDVEEVEPGLFAVKGDPTPGSGSGMG